MSIQSLHHVTTSDGEKIALWQVINPIKDDLKANSNLKTKAQNILMIHGTFSDKRVSLGVAGYLARLGYTCYIMEWRGHGDSSIPKDDYNFETIAFYDIAATFTYLFDELKLDNLHAVTHSGGGICLTMFLTQNQHYIDKINSITMVACQAYGAVLDPQSYAKITLLKTLTRLLGYVPAKRFKLGSVNESYHTMRQWYNWNLGKNFQSSLAKHNSDYKKSRDMGFDYRQQMPSITTPIYAISAKGDHFIAPPSGCQLFLEDFDNPTNVFCEFAIANGHLEDYNHSRIILSRNAAKEVWPTIAAWIEKHNLPTQNIFTLASY